MYTRALLAGPRKALTALVIGKYAFLFYLSKVTSGKVRLTDPNEIRPARFSNFEPIFEM
jgi:hypothetical protein